MTLQKLSSRLGIIATAFLFNSCSTEATARHGVSVSMPCPKGIGYFDGCAYAVTTGMTMIQRAFFTGYAAQNGQVYVTRPPWNVAGVDYPVGVDMTHVAALGGFKDPLTATPPTGCTSNTSTQTITCSTASGSPTFDGWDFGLHGGWSLSLTSTSASTVTVENSRFADGAFLDQQLAMNGAGVLRTASNSCANLVVTQSEFRRDMTVYPNPIWTYPMEQGSGAACAPSFTATYNYVQGTPEHTFRSNSAGIYVVQYNYVEGFGGKDHNGNLYHTSGVNIEAGSSLTIGPQQFSYNVVLSGTQATGATPSGTASVSGFIMGSGSNIAAFQVDHNVLVANQFAGVNTMGRLLETLPQGDGLGTMADFLPSFNYMDPTGAFGCTYQHTSAAAGHTTQTMIAHATQVSNIDMLNGSNAGVDACFGHH